MSDVTIRDYIGSKKELTAEQVRKLPPGASVVLHSFDRWGSHQTLNLTVVQSGKKKILISRDWYGERIEKPIKKETDRFCYTED
jgi:hypothetical protein